MWRIIHKSATTSNCNSISVPVSVSLTLPQVHSKFPLQDFTHTTQSVLGTYVGKSFSPSNHPWPPPLGISEHTHTWCTFCRQQLMLSSPIPSSCISPARNGREIQWLTCSHALLSSLIIGLATLRNVTLYTYMKCSVYMVVHCTCWRHQADAVLITRY